MRPEVTVLPSPEALHRQAAEVFSTLAQETIRTRGRFAVALSGGSTPGPTYRLLSREPYRDRIPWVKVHVFWADERCVPPDDPASNYRLAHELLLAHVPVPAGQVHRIPGERGPEAAADAYEETLRGSRDRLDLILLGLGGDGHTAALFPGSAALDEAHRLTAAVRATYEDRPADRVTLSLPALNAARHVVFLVSGRGKAEAVRAVLEEGRRELPASRVAPQDGKLVWLLDAAAAGQLPPAVSRGGSGG